MACHESLGPARDREPVERQIKSSPFPGELFMRRVVEAAGVEPASGRLQSRGTTCLFRVICLPQRSHGQENCGMSPTKCLP